MEAACTLSILRVVDADLFEKFDHLKMSVVCRVIQTVEALRVNMVYCFTHRTLQQNFDYV